MSNNMSAISGPLFVTGIDTDAGKTYATAWLCQQLRTQGKNVVTQKFIQTGNEAMSEDIEKHRQLCGLPLLPEDVDHLTAPIIFTYPASAQLAAQIDGREIDLALVERCTLTLAQRYDVVLIEGAGGLMTPITDTYFTVDYIAEHGLPVALVTNSKLGSINHTILTLEAIAHRQLPLQCVLYNEYYDRGNEIIAADTRAFISRYIDRHFPGTPIYDVPRVEA